VEALPPQVLGSALPDTDSLDGDNHDDDDNNNDGDGDDDDDDGGNSAGHNDDNGSRDFSADHTTDSDNSGTNEGLFAKDEETLLAESGRRSERITQHTEAPVLFSDLSKKLAEIRYSNTRNICHIVARCKTVRNQCCVQYYTLYMGNVRHCEDVKIIKTYSTLFRIV
jgi:cobalamin biosynthesis protein CobT